MGHVANTYCVRVSLIQHLVTSVIPLPLPRDHPRRADRCFWAKEPMRYETQADLLRLLNMVCRHFACCCFSIRVTRSFDAVRLVVVACLATLADAVMRIAACDVPSLLCLSYNGDAEGPGEPFGFEVGSFAVESEDLQLSSPELHCARTRVLDYFIAQREVLEGERVLFRFERTMEFGDAEHALLKQLCLHMAFPAGTAPGVADLLPAYLSGESRLVLENFPELGFFRDIVLLFKMLMVPSSEALPEIRAWTPLDAALTWRHRADEGFIVSGFGRALNAAAMAKQAEGGDDSWLGGVFRKIVGIAERPRAPPSSADPSALVRAEVRSTITNRRPTSRARPVRNSCCAGRRRGAHLEGGGRAPPQAAAKLRRCTPPRRVGAPSAVPYRAVPARPAAAPLLFGAVARHGPRLREAAGRCRC